jgi:haloalkane dehalogenase
VIDISSTPGDRMINAEDRLPRTEVRLVGRRMSLADVGTGPPLLFLHGNATYSYTWRNIIPFLATNHRCLAPDMMGMGRSDLILPSGPGAYAFADHLDNLELLPEMTGITEPTVVVGHEFGAAMAVQLARRRPDLVRGLVLIEGVLRITNDTVLDTDVKEFLTQVRSDQGEKMVLTENQIIELYLPRLTARRLSSEEIAQYRAPYPKPGESRRAMLSMIRQLPLQSMPGPIDDDIEESRLWAVQSRVPKLVIGGNPGYLVPSSILGTAARWAETTVASVRGIHFLTEDSPARITALILDWLPAVEHR